VGGAVYGAFAAKIAVFLFQMAVAQASTAAGAFALVKQEFTLRALAFRVVAPRATQITALKKHRGADAGTVYVRASRYVKNRCRRFTHKSSS
jgi:hypothetical protein